MSLTRVSDRRRLTALFLLFALWVGTAIVVLVVAVHSPVVRLRSRTALGFVGLATTLLVLCVASLVQLAHALGHRREPDRTVASAPTEITLPPGDYLRVVLDHLPVSFVLMDRDRRILAASSNFERITGRPLERILGRHCTRALWFDGFCAGCPSEIAGRSGHPEREVVRVFTPDGTSRFLEHVSVPIDDGGGPSSILEVVADVTDRLSLQEGMARAERLAVAGEMAAAVTHEMRNSLTSVKMILQLLQESSRGDTGTGELVEVALNSLYHTEAVLNDLLQFAGPAPLQTQEFDPVRMMHDAVKLVQPQLDEQHVALRIETEDSLLAAGDSEQLKTALLNLLLNASQAVAPGGSIVLRCQRQRLGADVRDVTPALRRARASAPGMGPAALGIAASPSSSAIVLAKSSEVLRLEVEDSGPGVPEALLDRVFDPFFTTRAKGTGLGLPMVKRIANSHGGTVTVRNLEAGCVFSILLPLPGEELA